MSANVQIKAAQAGNRADRELNLSPDSAPRIMIVAGEVSGDEHGAAVVASIRKYLPEAKVFGMGGSRLRAAGVETVVDAEAHASVMGFTEVVGKLRGIFKAFDLLVETAKKNKPEIAILLDFPDFNLRLAKALKKQGVKVLYFISPQLWAWRSYRVHSIKRNVEKVAAIFPFEVDFYHRHGVNAEYVGHPFLDRPFGQFDRAEFLAANGLDAKRPVIALLPGSRRAEVRELFQTMVEAFLSVKTARPGIQAIVPIAPTLSEDYFTAVTKDQKDITFVSGKAREVLHAADIAIVASGTATVEAALAEIPFCVAYRMSPLTYRIARLLVRGVKHIAMPNLIAGREIVREFIQDDVTPERLANELERLLGNEAERNKVKNDLRSVRTALGRNLPPNSRAADRVAEIVMQMLGSHAKSGRM